MRSPERQHGSAALGPVAHKLGAFAPLDDRDLEILRAIRGMERFGGGRTIRAAGDPRLRPRFLTQGWAARQRLLADGRRQIISIVLPGDLIGFSELDGAASGAMIVALTPCETADAAPLFEADGGLRGGPGLQAAFTAAEAFEHWLVIEQVVRLGRRTALERAAHLVLEVGMRLRMAGLSHDDRFPMPITQEVLSDVLGLSVVHINRTFLQLRREKWIDLHHRTVEILRKDQIAAVADFQPPHGLFAAESPRRWDHATPLALV